MFIYLMMVPFRVKQTIEQCMLQGVATFVIDRFATTGLSLPYFGLGTFTLSE